MRFLAFLNLLLFAVHAEETAIQQRGRKVVESALDALGGQKFLTMTDRVEMGRLYSFYHQKVSGAARATLYTRYLPRPEGVKDGFFGQRERQSYSNKKGHEDNAVVFNELEAFNINFRGATPIATPLYDRYRDSTLRNIFYILRQRRNEPGMIFEWRETTTLDNLPVDVLEITDPDNRVVKVFFHLSTHMPMRQIYTRRDPESKELIEEVSLYSKYRDAGGGVMWPYSVVRHRNGEKIFELFSESVKINQPLKDDLFSLPSGMKVIKTRER